MDIENDLNLKKQATDFGIKIWQTPGFVSLLVTGIGIIMMATTYFLSGNDFDPQMMVIVESVIAAMVMIISFIVIKVSEQVIKLNKQKNEFVSVASHQLRTPLSAIHWEIELLMTKFKKGLSEKQLKNVETISSLCDRMTRLVNDLLEVTRIDQNRLMLKKEPVDIIKIINEQITEQMPLAEARNVHIIFSPKNKSLKVIGDDSKLKMVLENLISNAIKYTTNRGKIEIGVSRKDNYVVTSIKDNGVGIPSEQIERVFEKFFRSDNAVKYQTEGTGLGLYIVKNIVEQSGGRLWFQSVENLGSVFSFSLPVKK